MQLPAHTDISGGPPQSSVPAFRLINDELERVKRLIDEQLAVPACAGVAMSYLQRQVCSGKMLRPGLVLLAGALCGPITDEHIRVAAVAEMIHNAALLHDDVIDEGQKRRGEPTVNSLWGNESAVLLGDFLLSKVFRMCADLEPQVARIIAAATVQTCEGELRQLTQRQNWQLSESEYIDIITEKSAALFSRCCFLGVLLADGSKADAQLLADFGLNTGIAFQITDDLLDIIGDENKTGKTLGSDVDKNKLTLVVIHLLRTVGEREKSAIINLLSLKQDAYLIKGKPQGAICNTQYDKEALVKMTRSYGSLKYAHGRAQEFVAKALQALADFREGDAKDALIETARFAGRQVI
jgi:octaprenyl-diphosphate synthase